METVALPDTAAGAFRRQRDSCTSLGSAFTASICGMVADSGLPAGPVHKRISNWPNRLDGAGGDAVALRLTGALHFLVLSGRDDELAAVYPPHDASPQSVANAVNGAVSRHGDFIDRYLDSPPQTNETGRSAALLPAFLFLRQRCGLPLVLSELGSSAGLNQNWHRYRYEYGHWGWGDLESPVTIACEWRGEALPQPLPVTIAESAGCDIAPIPTGTREDRLRLQSYVWADQPARLERLAGALAVAESHPPAVAHAGAADWLADRLRDTRSGHLHVVFHTIMWQYIPADEQARARTLIEDAGRRATADAPFAWLGIEADETSGSAGSVLTLWDGSAPEGEAITLGRCDFHGRWIDWRPAA